MPRNKMTDLNNILFAQLERLDDEELTEAELKKEVSRARAMAGIANSIVSNAAVGLKAIQVKDSLMGDGFEKDLPVLLQEPGESI